MFRASLSSSLPGSARIQKPFGDPSARFDSDSWTRELHFTPAVPCGQGQQRDTVREGPDGSGWGLAHIGAANFRSTAPGSLAKSIPTSLDTAVAALVRAGLGVGYLPDWLVAEDVATGQLRPLLRAWSAPGIGTWLIHRAEHRRAARIRAFVEAMTTA